MFKKSSSNKEEETKTTSITTSKKDMSISQLPITTVLAEDISITGDLKGSSSIRVNGNLKGNIEMNKGIVIGENAKVIGDLTSEQIIVYGSINGNINCQKLFIKKTGKVTGDLKIQTIEIEMGGEHNGHLQMNHSAEVSFAQRSETLAKTARK